MKKNNSPIRVRFAPSPTGYFHIGSARTALFNFLFAQNKKGSFILRIEDTDKQRSEKKHEEDIMRSLKWLGLDWDEGVKEEGEKGNLGPYRQSERSEIYKKYILKLIEEEKAYYCFCQKEDLEENRKKQREKKEAPRYEGVCSSFSKNEVDKFIKEGKDFVIRIRVPEDKKIEFTDKIRKKVSFNTRDIGGDFVIAKSDLTPLYNFACAVDDHEMKITHVIRGEDHISNTPRQIIIQEALGFKIPDFAHLPLILGSDKSKLSKRHGTVSMYEYKEKGYLPEALVNFIALLGWGPGSDEEFFSIDEIIDKFSLEDCQKSGAVFNVDKLNYINGYYIRNKKIEDLVKICIPYLIEAGLIEVKFKEEQYPPAYGGIEPMEYYYVPLKDEEFTLDKIKEIISLYQERMKTLQEVGELTDYFFKKDLDYDESLLIWKNASKDEIVNSLDKSIKILSNIKNWNREVVQEKLLEGANEEENRGIFLWPLRVSLSGKKASASPFDIAYVLGMKESIYRLQRAKEKLKK